MIRLPALFAVLLCAQAATAQVIDRVVAVVNSDPILESDLKSQVEFYARNNRMDPNAPGLRDQVLQSMINEKLIIARAIEDSVTVTDEEVQQQLDAVIQQRIQQVGSEARLEELYGMPLSRLRREFRDEMRQNLLSQKLQQQRFGNEQVSRYEVENFYQTYRDSLPRVPEEVELAHILIKPVPTEKAKDAARKKIQALIDSLKAGADFASLARRYSEDPGSAPQGGDLGLVRRGQFVKEFESAVFSLSEGQTSGIVETEFGYHIIQLLERRGDAVHARHILIKIERTPDADSVTIARLDSIRARALAGENFGELAKKFSEDKETNLVGGNLGTQQLDQLDKNWLATIADLKAGQISNPARIPWGSSYAYHIVLLKSRTPSHAMSLDEDYHKLEAMTMNFRRMKDYQTWIDELKQQIYWRVVP